jgi:hypothetical protein
LGQDLAGQISMVVLDSPNTTSAITYQVHLEEVVLVVTAFVQALSKFWSNNSI